MKKYTIEITEEQMWQLERATETMARLINGQMFPMKDLCEFAWDRHVAKAKELDKCGKEFCKMRDKVSKNLDELHTLCWDIPNGTDYGCHHSKDSDILWDMYQVFRHQRFLDMPVDVQKRMRWTVLADTPMKFGCEPLCTVTKVEISD